MKRLLISILICLPGLFLHAQRYTISGYIQDASSGEALIGANIYSSDGAHGTASNSYGFFSFTLEQGEYEIVFSYVGYQSEHRSLDLKENVELSIKLNPSMDIEEVEITATLAQSVKSTQMSSIDVSVESIKKVPAILGEVDVLKAIQLLPGVQSGTEGSSGLYVRGGGPDQNLILLDGTPVYNATHLFGFFSVFNVDAINNVTLIKGGFPARYGGRSSSVLDISLREGNSQEFRVNGSVGILASKLTVEGPIIKDRTSFLLSARRTYIDKLAQPLLRELVGGDEYTNVGYYFYDLNAKINHKFSSRDRLYFSIYSGEDSFYQTVEPYTFLNLGVLYTEQSESGFGWGNITSAMRWNHQFTNKLFSNATLTYSKYNYQVKNYMESIVESADSVSTEINSLQFVSGIQDISGKIDFDYIPSSDHFVRFGANYIHHTFKPGASVYKLRDADIGSIDTTFGENLINASEYAAYVEDDFVINDRIKANIGLHYSGFVVNDRFYHSLQPRISGRFLVNNDLSIKASYSRMQQYIHLLTNNTIGLPTDLWVPSTDRIRPQLSDQVALGISRSLGNQFLISVEGYYKNMNNLIEYSDGASFMGSSTSWEDKVESGKGWSYGGELYVEKKMGKVTGWLGYTLSWSNRLFDGINNGEVFPYKYDRRHDLALVVNIPLEDNWEFSANWIFGTGTAHTLATERYFGNRPDFYYQQYYYGSNAVTTFEPFSGEIYHVDSRNSFRAADYHRLDVSFQKTKQKKWGEVTWTLGLYNAYNRKNPFYYYIGYDTRNNRALRRVSLFPILPSVTYNFRF